MDLIEIERMTEYRARWGERGLRRIFSGAELTYCLGKVDPAPSLAARFAAKEAFFKATGFGWGPGGDWVDVEVIHAPSGAPALRLTGKAAESLEKAGGTRSHLSLTHARSTAAAVVVLESGPAREPAV